MEEEAVEVGEALGEAVEVEEALEVMNKLLKENCSVKTFCLIVGGRGGGFGGEKLFNKKEAIS